MIRIALNIVFSVLQWQLYHVTNDLYKIGLAVIFLKEKYWKMHDLNFLL